MEQQELKTVSFRGFFGNYQHSLDVKNRAFVPAKFKDGLGTRFVVTKGLETCLFGYHIDEWENMTRILMQIPFTDSDGRGFLRFFIGNAEECDIDKQGRFGLPQKLRDYAQLTKDISFVGMMDHFEIWDTARWSEANSRYDFNADIQAEKMQKYLKSANSSAFGGIGRDGGGISGGIAAGYSNGGAVIGHGDGFGRSGNVPAEV